MSFSGNVTAVLGKGLAASLGKKGTSSDITLYNHKVGDAVLSFVEPSSYPDKIQSLISALNMANQVVLKIDEVNAFLAETIVTLDAVSIPNGYIIVGGNVAVDNLKGVLSGTVLSSYAVVEEQVVSLREKLAELKLDSSGDAVIQADHSFSVKGVGTVVLGVVKKGVLKKHDALTIYPGNKKVLMKSIQVHDTDVTEAACGVRVGLALKDVTPEDIPRGTLLSTTEIKTTTNLKLDVTLSKYSTRALKPGDAFMINAFMNYIPVKVSEGIIPAGGKGKVTLALEKELPIMPARILVLDPGQKPPRVFGFGQI